MNNDKGDRPMFLKIKRFWRFIKLDFKLSPVAFSVNAIYFILFSFSGVFASWILKKIYELLELPNATIGMLIFLFILYFLRICLFGNTGNMERMLTAICTKRTRERFHLFFLDKSYRTKQDDLYSAKFYEKYQYIRKNMDNIASVSIMLINQMGMAVCTFIITLISIGSFDMVIVAAALVFGVLVAIISKIITRKKLAIQHDYVPYERKAAYYKGLLTNREHARDTRIFQNQDWLRQQMNENLAEGEKRLFHYEIQNAVLGDASRLLGILIPFFIDLYLLFSVSINKITAGDAIFLRGIVESLLYSVKNILQKLTGDAVEKSEQIERFEEFLGKDIFAYQKITQNETASDKNLPYGDLQTVEFKGVSYQYPGTEKYAIKNVNFRIEKGERISLLGYNGSGKSTVAKILTGVLQNYEGEVLINGKDARALSQEQRACYFGTAFQDFNRYAFTVSENIGVGNIEKINDKSMIQKASQKANIVEITDKLPDGMEQQLGKDLYENGWDLSGGEWQRIALARGYMSEAPMLVFDEPTASIDAIEEKRFWKLLNEGLYGETALIISHNLGYAQLSDRIILLHEGHILEAGTHDELLANHGLYAQMFLAQKEVYQ